MTRIPAFAILATFFESDISSSISLAVAAQLPFLFSKFPPFSMAPYGQQPLQSGNSCVTARFRGRAHLFGSLRGGRSSFASALGLGGFFWMLQDEVPVPKALLGKAQWGDGNLGPACGC